MKKPSIFCRHGFRIANYRLSARSNMVAQINRVCSYKNAESRLKHAPYASVTVIGISISNRRVDVNLRGRHRSARPVELS